ncbi:hypothetical protein BC939DRAFT_52596 [Gamsiella multidivaricata]|uniref:uncharacterized protein n=1 Tax=Gamsiella multidivaricata TaxID=101098 RepID=UPI00221E52D7|nr:uncharacterized protein BC939DRAFT_52596 [Gamsiella multidivaricata]KAI7816326.1 hypothetical protein BC939DRAFT_52596 [Gamsiella multidivaricata]
MSSPINRIESPSQDEHAKRKRDELEALEKQGEGVLSTGAKPETEANSEEVPPKKIKPEVEADEAVSRAEVKQIQRNLKTMPLEDVKTAESSEHQSKDMDDVESDQGSNDDVTQDESSQQPAAKTDTPIDTESTPSSVGDQEAESANTSVSSPFASVKPTESVFGSSSATLKGLNATSTASPFAAVANTNIFDSKPAPFSGGFGNASSVSPFATAASSTNVFGGESAKSIFGQSSTTSTSGFGASSGAATDSTAGSIFGTKSVLGSTAGANPSTSAFSSASQPTFSGSFSTFGGKHGFGKEASFTSGSFIDQESSQERADFGSLLSQDVGDNDRDPEQGEDDEHSFGAGAFTNADQIDVHTGEEDEMNIYQTKGKLYADTEKNHAWKERGKGTFKVNVSRKDTKLARLVMRTDGVLRLILNVAIFPDMNVVITGEKYVRFIGIEEGKPISFLLKILPSLFFRNCRSRTQL